jgi:threonine dehydratase
VEQGAITFELCRTLVDDYDLVSESEIEAAMRLAFDEEQLVIEGAAGVAIASALRQASRWPNRRVVVLLCGGNIGPAEWARVVGEGKGERGKGT